MYPSVAPTGVRLCTCPAWTPHCHPRRSGAGGLSRSPSTNPGWTCGAAPRGAFLWQAWTCRRTMQAVAGRRPTGCSRRKKSPCAVVKSCGPTRCGLHPCWPYTTWMWCCATARAAMPCGWTPHPRTTGVPVSVWWASSASLCWCAAAACGKSGRGRCMPISRVWMCRSCAATSARGISAPNWPRAKVPCAGGPTCVGARWTVLSPMYLSPMSMPRWGAVCRPWRCSRCKAGLPGGVWPAGFLLPARACSSRPQTACSGPAVMWR